LDYDSCVQFEGLKKTTEGVGEKDPRDVVYSLSECEHMIERAAKLRCNYGGKDGCAGRKEYAIFVRREVIVLPLLTGDWVSVSGTGGEPGRVRQAVVRV
jgi:hypothetical protein